MVIDKVIKDKVEIDNVLDIFKILIQNHKDEVLVLDSFTHLGRRLFLMGDDVLMYLKPILEIFPFNLVVYPEYEYLKIQINKTTFHFGKIRNETIQRYKYDLPKLMDNEEYTLIGKEFFEIYKKDKKWLQDH